MTDPHSHSSNKDGAQNPGPENAVFRKRIKWVSISLIAISICAFFLKKLDGWMIVGFPFFLLGINYLVALDKNNGRNRDFAHTLLTDRIFRFRVLLLSIFCILGGILAKDTHNVPFKKMAIEQWAIPMGLIFGGFFGLIFLISNRLGTPDQTQKDWSEAQKRFSSWVAYILIFLFITGKISLHILTSGIVEELKFLCLFFLGGIVPGWFFMDFFKNRFPDFFQNEDDAKSSLRIQIWLLAMLLSIESAAFANWKLATTNSFYEKKVVVLEENKSGSAWTLKVDWNGRSKKFSPNWALLDAVEPHDTVIALVSKGLLGFEYVREFRSQELQ